MTARLGRRLKTSEHVHHGKRGTLCDAPSNLKLIDAGDHNRHHKTGAKHSTLSRRKIARSLRAAYSTGRRPRPNLKGRRNPFYGKTHTKEARAKMAAARRK
jgi:hypothetical protein